MICMSSYKTLKAALDLGSGSLRFYPGFVSNFLGALGKSIDFPKLQFSRFKKKILL